MKKMIIADPIREMTAILAKVLGAEVEVSGTLFLAKKTRKLVIKSENSEFSFKMDCDISFKATQQSGITINHAEILLLPQELPIFLSALINHADPLPSNYSQRLVMEPNVYCLYLESRELPETFAERLATALKTIDC